MTPGGRTFVLGLGNVLMGDDGFGPAVVCAFERQYVVGPHVEVVDLGTPGLDLAPWLADAQHAIIVDTVRANEPPGTLRLYDKRDLVRHVPFARVGPHDPGVKESVLALEFAGRAPHTVALIGAVPERVALGTELSPPLRAAVQGAVDAIAAALERLTLEVRPRRGEPLANGEPQPWWTTTVAGTPGRARG